MTLDEAIETLRSFRDAGWLAGDTLGRGMVDNVIAAYDAERAARKATRGPGRKWAGMQVRVVPPACATTKVSPAKQCEPWCGTKDRPKYARRWSHDGKEWCSQDCAYFGRVMNPKASP